MNPEPEDSMKLHPLPRLLSRPSSAPELALVLAIVASVLVACDKHPSRPFTPTLDGIVLDVDSQPVAGARIAVVYRIELTPGNPADTCGESGPRRGLIVYPNPASSPRFNADLHVSVNAQVEMRVHDRSGNRVRNLADSFFAAGRHVVVWDGRADDGSELPNGIYVVHWKSTEGDSVFAGCRRVLLDVVNSADLGGRAIATTGRGGRFSIPLSSLPVDDGGLATDSHGNFVGGFTIVPDVTVCALASAAPGAATACADTVGLGDLKRSVNVTLSLP